MKLKSSPDLTYAGYLHHARYDSESTGEQEISYRRRQFRQSATPMPSILPIFFVIDYTKRDHLII